MQFWNPNLISKQATPEGHAGVNASIFLPFYQYGRWFPSGQQLTFLTSEIPQRSSRILNGLSRPNTFRKDASSCPVGTSIV